LAHAGQELKQAEIIAKQTIRAYRERVAQFEALQEYAIAKDIRVDRTGHEGIGSWLP